MWCYRRHRDGLPYGVIRDVRDAQIDYNKRASKALYILSTVRVIMDEGAVADVDELRTEIARPDGIIVKRANKELKVEQDKQLAQEHLQLMEFDGQMIRDISGVTDQNLGQNSNDMSGKAIGKLQDQGSIVTAPLFDNKRLAIQMQTEIQLSLIEQFYTMPKVVRLVGENKPLEWLKLNQWDEGAAKFINDITKSKADYIVDEQDFQASTREAMFLAMMELISKLPPEVGMAMLDMVIDFANVPNKEEIVSRIRKLNGQSDPTRKPTPDEQAAQQAAQQKQQAMEQVQMRQLTANATKTEADAAAAGKKVDLMDAQMKKLINDAVTAGVTAAYQAMQAAQIVSTVPGVTPVADAILAGAGYVDGQGQDPNLPAPGPGAMAALPAPGMQPPPELLQADGAMQGIETPASDGITQPMMEPQ
jgi:peroxiredoxin family protein